MASDVELISQRSILNRPVLDRDSRREIGHVDVLWAYPPAHRVYGFICKTGLLGRSKLAVKLPQIAAIADDGIQIVGSPEPTQADKVRQLPTLIGAEVWSEEGDRLGKIVDYRFDRKTGFIAHYLFVAGDWAGLGGDLYRLPPRKIASLEEDRVLVPDVSVPKLKIDQEGFQHIFEEAGDILQETYFEVQRDLSRLTRRTKRLTEQAKEKLEIITEQAKEKAVGVTEHLRDEAQVIKEKAAEVTEQLRDEAQVIAEQAKETSQTVTERVKERTQTLAEQAKEVSQTVTERVNPSDTPSDKEPLSDEWPEEPSATVDPLSVSPFGDQPIPDPFDEEWPDDDDDWKEPAPATPTPAATQPNRPANSPTEDDDEPWI